jgi:hypothetical protein
MGVAILVAIMVIRPYFSINLYTDSLEIVNCGSLWKTINTFIKETNLNLSIFKVKSHSNDIGNDIADGLCKLAIMEDDDKLKTLIKLNNCMSWEYLVYWRGEVVRESSREFMKKVNQIRYKVEWLTLDVNRTLRLNLPDIIIDWKRSLEIIIREYKLEVSN